MPLPRRTLPLLASLLAIALSFAAGFTACLHLKSASPDSVRKQNLLAAGSAPAAVRSAVLQDLDALQSGYLKRDPGQIAALTANLFPSDGEILILGTDTGEWVRGSSDAGQFIAADWRYWGDLRLDVENAIVWSRGDVAWLATIGNVSFKNRIRPVRFTAVLTNENNRWVFRQMHFQWDDKDPVRRDLLRPQTYIRLLTRTPR